MNGCFKMVVTKAKEELLKIKEKMPPLSFGPTDIIPIVNKAWAVSFGNSKNGKKALAKRGWNPLIMALLKNRDV